MFLQVFHEQTHWISKYHKNPYNWTRDKYHDTQHEHTRTHTHSCRKHCKHGGCATTPAKGGERRALLTHQFHSRVCVTKNQSPCRRCKSWLPPWSRAAALSVARARGSDPDLLSCLCSSVILEKSRHGSQTKTTASTHSSTGQRQDPGCFLLFYDSWTLTQLLAKCNSNRFTSHLKVDD